MHNNSPPDPTETQRAIQIGPEEVDRLELRVLKLIKRFHDRSGYGPKAQHALNEQIVRAVQEYSAQARDYVNTEALIAGVQAATELERYQEAAVLAQRAIERLPLPSTINNLPLDELAPYLHFTNPSLSGNILFETLIRDTKHTAQNWNIIKDLLHHNDYDGANQIIHFRLATDYYPSRITTENDPLRRQMDLSMWKKHAKASLHLLTREESKGYYEQLSLHKALTAITLPPILSDEDRYELALHVSNEAIAFANAPAPYTEHVSTSEILAKFNIPLRHDPAQLATIIAEAPISLLDTNLTLMERTYEEWRDNPDTIYAFAEALYLRSQQPPHHYLVIAEAAYDEWLETVRVLYPNDPRQTISPLGAKLRTLDEILSGVDRTYQGLLSTPPNLDALFGPSQQPPRQLYPPEPDQALHDAYLSAARKKTP